jgi:hypothetical protein
MGVDAIDQTICPEGMTKCSITWGQRLLHDRLLNWPLNRFFIGQQISKLQTTFKISQIFRKFQNSKIEKKLKNFKVQKF